MAVKHRDPFSYMLVLACCILLFISTAFSYDGPAGVTFRAPHIAAASGKNVVVREGISVKVKVRADSAWSLEIDGKGRAFPDRFIATIADSEMTFSLLNRGKQKVKTTVLIPFDSSNTIGTGFTGPFSVAAILEGRPVEISNGPELPRGMMKVRSYRLPVEIPALSAVTIEIRASHPLAVHPAWYQFICMDQYAVFPGFRSLTKEGCALQFEFISMDERVNRKPFKLEWRTSPKELFMEQMQAMIKFRSDSVQWVRVHR